LPSFYFCQVGLPNCWRPIFLVLPKLYGCQVGLLNCWSCSYMLYYCRYFKLDLSFYTFASIFWMRRMIKVARKVNGDKYFDTKGVVIKFTNHVNNLALLAHSGYIFIICILKMCSYELTILCFVVGSHKLR
jgi:hypothetical protein